MVLGKLRIGLNEESLSGLPPAEAPVPRDDDPFPATFLELLEYCRDARGDNIAFQQKIRRDWQRFSYNDMYERAHTLAAAFVASGVQPGERVVMVLENSYDWVTLYYGIVLAGAIAVPIYYDLKPNEIADMATHADPAAAAISAKVLPKLDAPWLSALRTLVVVGGNEATSERPPAGMQRGPETVSMAEFEGRATPAARDTVRERVIQPDDVASIVFTSGTSGGNKGVMLTHRNFMANSRQVSRSIPFSDRDRIVIVLPLHHAFPFTITLAVAPYIGGVVTFENDLRRIRDRMAEVKPTIFIGVPALFEVMYRNILHSIEVQGKMETFQKGLRIAEATKQRTGINIGRIVFRELHKRLGGSLRFMVSGGAALNPQVSRDFAALGVQIIQGWGLTEAAPVLTAQRWNPRKFYMSSYFEDRTGSIGQAVEGVELALIDVPEKELYVHLHGEGELIARGENITPGYWRSEEATEAIKLGEWLRTGDIGRIDEDGTVWITGRSKFVVVLESGEKIYPDEVEGKLEVAPAIEDIVVLGRKLRGKTQVFAVVYPNREEVLKRLSGAEPTAESVHAVVEAAIREAEGEVAAYKRVVEFMLTDEPLPRTPIRKVMRGHIRETYTFDAARWAQSWQELQDGLAEPAATPESEAEELTAAGA